MDWDHHDFLTQILDAVPISSEFSPTSMYLLLSIVLYLNSQLVSTSWYSPNKTQSNIQILLPPTIKLFLKKN